MPFIPYTPQSAIGMDNVLIASGAVLTASSEQDGYEVENIADGFTYDFWRPDGGDGTPHVQVQLSSPLPVDYFAIAGHNLGSIGGTARLQGSDDGVSWTNLIGVQSPTNDGPILWQLAVTATHDFYRLLVTGAGASIGVLNVGALTLLPEGMYVGVKIPKYNRAPGIMNNKSAGGQFLGRSRMQQGAAPFEISQDYVSPTWVDTVWQPLSLLMEMRPFFFSWRKDSRPADVAYCWTEEAATQEIPNHTYFKIGATFVAQVYEPRNGASGA
jgi:hypothetical protein